MLCWVFEFEKIEPEIALKILEFDSVMILDVTGTVRYTNCRAHCLEMQENK